MASRAGVSVSTSCDDAGWVDAPSTTRTASQATVAGDRLRFVHLFDLGVAENRGMRDLGRGVGAVVGVQQHVRSGARRNRTADLLLAKQALSQLSYGPDRLFELELYLRRLPVGR